MKHKITHIKGRTYYRTVDKIWGNMMLEAGPSFNHGGKFNTAGVYSALYFSEDSDTAYKEWLRDRRQDEVIKHMTFTFEIYLSKVIDISGKKDCKTVEWRSGGYKSPQIMGMNLYLEGIEGILYESVKSRGVKNLAVFPANILKTNAINLLTHLTQKNK